VEHTVNSLKSSSPEIVEIANVILASFTALEEVLDGRIIRCGLWPYIPDLTPCDFYLWRCLNDKVYKTNPCALQQEAESAIRFQ
jgi:hypothetical protein